MSIDRIYEQLSELTLVVDLLEQTIAQKEIELQQAAQQAKAAPPARAAAPQAAGQIDMFGEWTAGGKAANVNTASALAKKLDSAIENVQWLLKQAEA